MSQLSFEMLLIGMILAMTAFRFILAAYQGLIALVGQEGTDVRPLEHAGEYLLPGCAHFGRLRLGNHQRESVASPDLLPDGGIVWDDWYLRPVEGAFRSRPQL
jgi:hypothetical protein